MGGEGGSYSEPPDSVARFHGHLSMNPAHPACFDFALPPIPGHRDGFLDLSDTMRLTRSTCANGDRA
jgi:hypothetical protein